MATVKGDIRLNDFMTRNLKNITQAINMTVSELENLNRKMNKDVDVSGLNRIRETVSLVDIELEEAVKKQERLNQKTKEATSAYSNLGNVIKTAIGAIGINKLVGLSDENTQIRARLNLITNGNADETMEKILASAQKSRADYFSTADVVSKLGLRAGDAFSNTDEIIQFSENLNKMFVIAGASQAEMSSASLQLTQALGSGVLRGEELNAVFEAAPNIIQTIADSLGVPIGQVRNLASEGKITADVVRNAILSATNDINSQFESMPMTWGQVWTMTVNKIITISQPLLNFISILADNWSIIEPIVLGIAAAVGLYTAALLAYNVQQGISNGLETLGTIAKVAHGAATAAEAAATTGMTEAQIAFNAALYACPLTWIVIAIIAIIAAIYLVIAVINKVTDSTYSATGVIMGIIFLLAAFFYNSLIVPVWNAIARLVNFFGNCFKDPVASIKILFLDMATTVIGLLNNIAGLLDNLFGTSFSAGTSNLLNNLEKTKAKIKEESGWEEIVGSLEQWDYNDAINQGYNFGKGLEDKIGGAFSTDGLGDIMDGLNVGNVQNVENVEGEVDVASEDLKLLRELAEQQYIQNYISNTPVVYVTTGDINENADIDYLISGVASRIRNELDSSMEGMAM